MNKAEDIDPLETQEWLDALDSVLESDGADRAHYLLERLIDKARRTGAYLPYSANTAYVNTIPAQLGERLPGDQALERRIRSLVRWNAMAMVVQANRENSELGGHIASYASAATLFDVGFDHFFHAPAEGHGGDLVFFQGHSAPGVYARAYLEGRLSEEQLHKFRQEVDGGGLSSYPHPWLMPSFWQFPTVSMGLGPLMAIYQARFMRYLDHREMTETSNRNVWAFMGDGEMDEPESLGAISLAARERLDNLIFVINCNLQRLDGPVRGNGKIIQELEAVFRGAGWNVIKVIWGSYWDPLLARDKDGLLVKRMEEVVDGDYQAYKANGGAYVREHFFGKYPELADMVATMSDDDIWRLNRGGHDPHKVYAAYHEAAKRNGKPTVILAKTVKGYGMGEAGEGQNVTHQQKKMGETALRHFRDRFNIPVTDEQIETAAFYHPGPDSEEVQYMQAARDKLGGALPARSEQAPPLQAPDLSLFDSLLKGTDDREMSTTMAWVRALASLLRDKTLGKHVVPIVPDEARTFGMEGMFRQYGIYSSVGQLYKPQDAEELMFYKEDKKGQILEEGINEAGAMSSWIAAGTAYANHGVNMIPFYVYYSMFGFQRVGDLAWAAGDMQVRGFLMGGTAGRTTLAGEGLQHQDGHSHLLASTIPNCISYDPTFAYEVAVIMQDGLRRMYQEQENVFYYITIMNENYAHPPMPEGAEEGIRRGMYLLRQGGDHDKRIQLLGSGTILREVLAAADKLESEYGISADVWSATSFNELRRDGIAADRWNGLHPDSDPREAYVTTCLKGREGPVLAATDYMRTYADQIRAWVPQNYHVLGTDGFGRSDSRKQLRKFFEVDHQHVTAAALSALAQNGDIESAVAGKAISALGIDPEKPQPWSGVITMANVENLLLPDIGDFDKVDVIEVLVGAGDSISMDQSVITLESDKATMEIPAPGDGVVVEMNVAVGDKVGQGDLILTYQASAADAAPAAEPEPVVEAAPEPAPVAAEPVAEAARAVGEKVAKPQPMPAYKDIRASAKSHASPSVRRFARELGVDLSQVEGSGRKGRIVEQDVREWVKGQLGEGAVPAAAATVVPEGVLAFDPLPEIDFSKFGEIETQPLSRIQKISGKHLARNWATIPHVTQFDEADITELEDFRKQSKKDAEEQGVKLTFLPFLMKACVSALRKYPTVNSSLAPDGGRLILKKYLHIGIAVDTPDGLVVPVVRDVDKKGLFDLARELMEISARARDGKLEPRDIQGASFTISSLGGIGGTAFTPIINAPEVAILGVSRASMKPVWNGSDFAPRLMMPFSLSYDHRVIDGALGARFTSYLSKVLSDIRRSLL